MNQQANHPARAGVVQKPSISLSEPFPLLDSGFYLARCTEATYEWARQWKKWIARLVLEPQNYQGRAYTGRLCKFLALGRDQQKPYAGPQSHFRRLLVEVNGAQPIRPDTDMRVFVGLLYEIEVATVTTDREGKPRVPEHWYSIVRTIHPACSTTLQPINSSPALPSTQKNSSTHSTDQHSNTENLPLAERRVQRRDFDFLNRSSQ